MVKRDVGLSRELLERIDSLAMKVQSGAETPDGAGWLRLREILKGAQGDPLIAASDPAHSFLDVMLELVSDALFAKTAEQAFEPLFSVVKSEEAKEIAAVSHEGQARTREYACRLFLEKIGEWGSLSEAADQLAPIVIAESRKYSRPLSPSNARNTISIWLGELVKRDPAVMAKLNPRAQQGIERARLRTPAARNRRR